MTPVAPIFCVCPTNGVCVVLQGSAADGSSGDTTGSVGGVDVSRHFSYYAFEGGKGESVWKHASGAFQKDLQESSEELRPQDDYR